jgi:RNA polymerase sigma-70 factor (ECF subfamily)
MNTLKTKQDRFLKAYRACHDGFLRYCSALAFEQMDVEDLVQDVLLTAYQKYDELADPAKLQHYLIRAARNRAVSLRRRAGRKAGLTELHGDRLRSKGATADQLADVHLLYRAINKLPAKQRDAILLFDISGYPLKDIAAMQKVTEASIKMRLKRGRDGLKKALTEPTTRRNSGLTTLLLTAKTIAL